MYWRVYSYSLMVTEVIMAQSCNCHPEPEAQPFDTLRPRQNGRHFADDVFKCIFLNENVRILLKSSLEFVPKGTINNIPSSVPIMAWRRPGDTSLFEPMIVSLLTHICFAGLNELRYAWAYHTNTRRNLISGIYQDNDWIFNELYSTSIASKLPYPDTGYLGLYSPNGRTFCRQISRSRDRML